MNTPRSSRPWLKSLVAGLTVTLLAACSSTYHLTLRSANPESVASVLVLFGSEAEFQGKSTTAEIASVIHPSKLSSYYGYAEFEVSAGAAGPEWKERSAKLEQLRAGYRLSDAQPYELRFYLPRSRLEVHDDLGIAVVVRTANREYRMKRWQHAALVKSDGTLVVDVASREITSSF